METIQKELEKLESETAPAVGDGSGVGNSLLPYARVATQVVCRICPDPVFILTKLGKQGCRDL
jgi:hypothetical protein